MIVEEVLDRRPTSSRDSRAWPGGRHRPRRRRRRRAHVRRRRGVRPDTWGVRYGRGRAGEYGHRGRRRTSKPRSRARRLIESERRLPLTPRIFRPIASPRFSAVEAGRPARGGPSAPMRRAPGDRRLRVRELRATHAVFLAGGVTRPTSLVIREADESPRDCGDIERERSVKIDGTPDPPHNHRAVTPVSETSCGAIEGRTARPPIPGDSPAVTSFQKSLLIKLRSTKIPCLLDRFQWVMDRKTLVIEGLHWARTVDKIETTGRATSTHGPARASREADPAQSGD